MTDLTFDHLYPYAELTDALHGLAADAPRPARAREHRHSRTRAATIWLATITNRATGPHDEKPALFVEANIHATEITASTAALHLVHHLVDPLRQRRRGDPRARHPVASTSSPGSTRTASRWRSPIRRRILRSSTRIYPRPDQQPGSRRAGHRRRRPRPHDARRPTRTASWKVHPDDARLLVPRALDEDGPGDYYRLLPEGTIHEYDGVLVPIAPRAPRASTSTATSPRSGCPRATQHGAGPFPTSEPEVRALVEAVVARPNICAYIAYHTFSARDPASVRRLRRRSLPDRGPARVPGARQARDRDHRLRGGLGVPRLQVRPEDVDHRRERRVGLRPPRRSSGGRPSSGARSAPPASPTSSTSTGSTSHPVEDDLRLLRWNDEVLGGDGLRRLVPVRPSAARAGRDRRLGLLPHLDERAARAHGRGGRAAQRVGGRAPARVAAPRGPRRSTAEPLGDGVWRVRLVVENTGWLPTNVSRKALERKAVRPVEAEIELPDGASLALGDAAPGARAARRSRPRPADARDVRRRLRPDRRPGQGRVGRARAASPGTTRRASTAAPRPRPAPVRGRAHPARERRRCARRAGGGGAVGAHGARADARRRDPRRGSRACGRGPRRRPRRSRDEHGVPAFAVVRRAARRAATRSRSRCRPTCSPTSRCSAARAGKALLLEKPLALDVAGAEADRRRRSPTPGVGSVMVLTYRFAPAGARVPRPGAASFAATGGRACFLSGAFLGGPYASSEWRVEHGRCSTSARTSSTSSTRWSVSPATGKNVIRDRRRDDRARHQHFSSAATLLVVIRCGI